jgi:hypothetical protein
MYMGSNSTDESKLVEIISDMAKKFSVRQRLSLINHMKLIEKWDEKRGSKRKVVNVRVDYSVKGKFYSDILENISTEGAYIRTTRLFQTGHSTVMVASLFKIERNTKVKGEIVRLTGEGFGVKFFNDNKEMMNL